MLVYELLLVYHWRILPGYFNEPVEKEVVFRQAMGNQILQEIINDNEIRVVTFA